MKFLLILIVVACYELTFTSAEINYSDLFVHADNYLEKVAALDNLWAKYLLETPGDLFVLQDLFEKSTNLFFDIDPATVSTDQQQHVAELQQKIRNYAVIKAGQMIANVLNGIDYPNDPDFSFSFGFGILLTYNRYQDTNDLNNPRLLSLIQLVHTSYKAAIDNIYDFKSADILAASLQQTYTGVPVNDYILFDFTVNAQLYLYWKFMERHDVNDLYLLHVGHYFNEIQNHDHYQQLDGNTKRRLHNAINTLPTSVQNLYFQPKFCLLNKAYSEYIYTTDAIEIDSERRYIFTWTDPYQIKGNGAWKQNLTSATSKSNPIGPQLSLTFALESYELNLFLYLEQNVENLMNLITSWRSGNAPDKSSWLVELVENQLVFSQNGFLMCASNKLYSTNRRFVYGYDDAEHTSLTPTCQWIAEPCPQ